MPESSSHQAAPVPGFVYICSCVDGCFSGLSRNRFPEVISPHLSHLFHLHVLVTFVSNQPETDCQLHSVHARAFFDTLDRVPHADPVLYMQFQFNMSTALYDHVGAMGCCHSHQCLLSRWFLLYLIHPSFRL
ncbi:hypothetical protein ABZP36_005938 [Zizania latifolia]